MVQFGLCHVTIHRAGNGIDQFLTKVVLVIHLTIRRRGVPRLVWREAVNPEEDVVLLECTNMFQPSDGFPDHPRSKMVIFPVEGRMVSQVLGETGLPQFVRLILTKSVVFGQVCF